MSANGKIDRVAYVGWVGIEGCEVFDLDEILTALVGPTGAGKSTLVMCLNYALLPDRRALEIRPVTDFRDQSIAGMDMLEGRINSRYGYAYVVLGITGRDGKPIVAGIHVQPIDGRAHLTAWLIRTPPENTPLQDILCIKDGEQEYYPDLPELKRHLAGNGIDLITCRGVNEYCQALYEAGILPSAMTSTNDRSLYAKILETTFMGGLSKDVAVKLKEYLLPAQPQVHELVRGLQECTNDVLKTRSALASASGELAILKSTYGVGRETVLTALHCIDDEVHQAISIISNTTSILATKRLTLETLEKNIPLIEEQITQAERTKKVALENSLLEWKLLGERKSELWDVRKDHEEKMRSAAQFRKQFNKGGEIWQKVAGQHERETYEEIKDRIERAITANTRNVVEIELEMNRLQEEDSLLSMDRSSAKSEHLAERLGGESLERALGHVSERESVSYEMMLGGLMEGVVGADIAAIATLQPSQDLPDMYWIGQGMPSTRPVREIGGWYASAVGDGYIVASKERAPVFGGEARKARRQAIAVALAVLTEKRNIKSQEGVRLQGNLESLLTNHEAIQVYLLHRHDALSIDQAVANTKRAFEQTNTDYAEAEASYLKMEGKIQKIEEPHEKALKSLREDLAIENGRKPDLVRDIADAESRSQTANARLEASSNSLAEARGILGSEFDHFLDMAKGMDVLPQNIFGLQAKRIADLGRVLGDERTLRHASFRDVDAQNHLSVVRIWPALMSLVRECINIDIADRDGEDLIEVMQKNRTELDTKLVQQENYVRINVNNIYLNINSAAKNQKAKIDKLSRLGHDIKFGNVTGIRIQLVYREKMLKILESFAENFAEQPSLFNNGMPVDQALKDFFDQQSNGIKMDGESLLDYRNYVDIVIEARRQDREWSPAAGLSGGEAIGCSLAIALMLTRSIASRSEAGGEGIKAHHIRPLFVVDEAQRLIESGHKILVDFARREKFQLIFAAPKLEPEYDCTLYSLNRVYTPEARIIIRAIKYRHVA